MNTKRLERRWREECTPARDLRTQGTACGEFFGFLFCLIYPRVEAEKVCNLKIPTGADFLKSLPLLPRQKILYTNSLAKYHRKKICGPIPNPTSKGGVENIPFYPC